MKSSKKIALCGMFGALSITILLIGFMIPMATYACPALAAFFLLPIAYEYKEKTAFTLYLAVSALALILIPEKEFVLMYVFVFGLYTAFKFKADKIKPKLLQLLLKSLFAFLSTLFCYVLLLVVFPNPLLAGEIGDAGIALIAAFFIVFVITFLMYDFAAGKMFLVYKYKMRPKLFKSR
ncbi:MAG: hypothetical protein J6C04_02305 [Oscillospiraceae bacterium]|nr:hypothetical protein [Oscillospiraceae bacterium]